MLKVLDVRMKKIKIKIKKKNDKMIKIDKIK